MSVQSLLRDDRIRTIISRLMPKEKWPSMRLRVEPRRRSGGLIGTAFDYAVRFEMQRRCPSARGGPWIAELVVDEFRGIVDIGVTIERVDREEHSMSRLDSDLMKAWAEIVDEARSFLSSYVQRSIQEDWREVATHALRLARIDPYYRAGFVDEETGVAPSDLEELCELLGITPWGQLDAREALWLNPNLGSASERVGGADCDLISDGRLIDLKTGVRPQPSTDLQQVIVYLLLAWAHRRAVPDFPAVSSVGMYYARHRQLLLVPVAQLGSSDVLEKASRELLARADKILQNA